MHQCSNASNRVLAYLSKSNSRTFQGPYEGYIRKTKLNQTGTFTSIHKLPRPQRAENGFYAYLSQKEAIWNNFFSINWFGHGVQENQIQALSRTFRQIQGLSRTMSVFKVFPGLENMEKKFKDFQGPTRVLFQGYLGNNVWNAGTEGTDSRTGQKQHALCGIEA